MDGCTEEGEEDELVLNEVILNRSDGILLRRTYLLDFITEDILLSTLMDENLSIYTIWI